MPGTNPQPPSQALKICLACWFSLVCWYLASCRPAEPPGLGSFAADFRAANQADDIGPMLALYELEGSTVSTRRLLRTALLYELGLPIKRIRFEPLSGAPEETIEYTHGGQRYGPTLPPAYRMQVDYATEDAFSSRFTLGQRADGSWRIVSSRPIESKEETASDRAE